jgi:hypothetical protein
MKHCASVTAQGSGQSDLPTLVRLSDLGSGDEHVAVLLDPGRCGLLRRWDDLFDDGVAAVFDLAGVEAELVALCFHAGRFSAAEAATWLAGRGLKPLLLRTQAGTGAADGDSVPAAPVGQSISEDGAPSECR